MYQTNRAAPAAPGIVVSLLCSILLSSASNGLADEPTAEDAKKQVTFYVMGDVPYVPAEDVLLPRQIAELPQDAEFVVHVGDIKGGAPPCEEAVYAKVSGMLSKATPPVFIIPGDNEWNDCIDPDPAQAWQYWEQYFMRFDRRWQHDLPVFRQVEREENFSFVKNHVLFVGINIVGGLVHDATEWQQRHADCLNWVRRNMKQFEPDVTSMVIFGHAKPAAVHKDFFDPFSQDAQQFGKPILHIHGDGHRWIHDRPFAARNVLRIQVDQGGIAPPLKVTITDDPTEPFLLDRRLPPPAGNSK